MQHFITEEMLASYALEFLLFQKNMCDFYEISPMDLFPDTMVYFNAYHYLPLNQKYLPFIHENFELSERKHRRIEQLKTLYIHQSDSSAYVQYIEKYYDQFKVGLRKRARARCYQLLTEWRDLLYSYLFEMREIESFATTRPDMPIWLNELLNYIAASEDPWSLIFEICHMDCLRFDHSMAELIVTCFLSRNLGEDEAETLLDIKMLITICQMRGDVLLYRKKLSNIKLSEEEAEKWSHVGDVLSEYDLASTFPRSVKDDFDQFQKQFMLKKEETQNLSRLIYCYLGEAIVSSIISLPTDPYKKDELIEAIMVRVKSDGFLQEAWMEELRQFLKKQEK